MPSIQHSDGRVQRGYEHQGGDFALPLRGGRVDQCCIDYALTLHIHGAATEPWSVRIEGSYRLRGDAGSHEWLRIRETDRPGDANRPIRLLLHRELESATVQADGGLVLEFVEDVALEVAPGDAYEAWQVTGPDQATWVGGVGGTVSIFEALT